jgi:hypothetical protein
MANAVQCTLRCGDLVQVRWVTVKKAVPSNSVEATGYDGYTVKTWTIETVYSGIAYDEKFHYHVIK